MKGTWFQPVESTYLSKLWFQMGQPAPLQHGKGRVWEEDQWEKIYEKTHEAGGRWEKKTFVKHLHHPVCVYLCVPVCVIEGGGAS